MIIGRIEFRSIDFMANASAALVLAGDRI
jgi:hypothetical protein